MEIILLQRVEKLGQMGDVVNVKDGYARNFLLPQGKALRANASNKKVFETRRAQLEAENLERRQEAEQVAEKMDGLTVTLIRSAGETGHLYGSVSGRDLAAVVTEEGFTISRSQVILDKPIKLLGLHPVRVRLHPEVDLMITVNVARSEEEAELQKERGSAMIGSMEELEAAYEEDALAEAETPAETEEDVPSEQEVAVEEEVSAQEDA